MPRLAPRPQDCGGSTVSLSGTLARVAIISIEIPDEQVARVVDAYSVAYGWRSVAEDGPRADFARRKLVDHIRETTLGVERAAAEGIALDAVDVGMVTPT